ncbi:DUF1398 domain-containing protein [Streptomyces sp. SID8366]|uniref:DUF1398 family protein n=1 Tax=unclassified Streptomyces TaxID=2593676 RepID=UPI000DB9E4D2|nr:DUF1398 family protein [Streptomyces sp. PsTaAH-130]MYU05679.1 DUF1398 domain-containing protein [Streptomyces sp. SID8366]MYU66006.1 DUF1398 domain-containing protein [Streptomyces sp. SID69]RAJ63729.1 uncharacterized protein YbcV (DUF1398 family) [Streptomyces sp. PsTaAH-130]
MTTDAISRLQAAMERGAAARPKAGGFPYLAESLRQAGVTHCRMAVPANAFLYLTEHGDVVVQGEPLVTGLALAPRFDEAALVAALRADQAGETTFPAFVRACWDAGIAWYDVDTAARTCTYYGSDGDSYTEDYPFVTLP